jgi:hypothetical protein
VLFTHTYRDTGTDEADEEQNYGLVRYDWTPKPSLDAFRAVTREGAPESRRR